MKGQVYVVDTNVLMRYLLKDDEQQFLIVEPYFLTNQHQLYFPIQTLCESVWIMQKCLKIKREQLVFILENLLSQPCVIFDELTVQYGLTFLKNGGDFADGVIAYETKKFGQAKLLTFDKKVHKLCTKLKIDYVVI